MSKPDLSTWENQLSRIENNLANEIAREVNTLVKKTVRRSLVEWYNDYSPEVYKRTYNLMNVVKSVKTHCKGNKLTISINSGYMENRYPGIWGQRLEPSAAFCFAIEWGLHGYGLFLRHESLPSPYIKIGSYILSGCDGQVNRIMTNALIRIFKQGGN